MSFRTKNGQLLENGLYLVSQFRPEKGVEHSGILDVGNRLGLPGLTPWSEPVVVHQPPSGLRTDWLSATGEWKVIGRANDEKATIARINEAASNPGYSLFSNNCEHFTEYAVHGVRRSPQLKKALLWTGGLAAAVFVLAALAPTTKSA